MDRQLSASGCWSKDDSISPSSWAICVFNPAIRATSDLPVAANAAVPAGGAARWGMARSLDLGGAGVEVGLPCTPFQYGPDLGGGALACQLVVWRFAEHSNSVVVREVLEVESRCWKYSRRPLQSGFERRDRFQIKF